jgi:hypothetical protein
MKAIIRTAYFDGEKVYQVVENPETSEASIEYTTGTLGCAEKYCEKYYGTDWGEE